MIAVSRTAVRKLATASQRPFERRSTAGRKKSREEQHVVEAAPDVEHPGLEILAEQTCDAALLSRKFERLGIGCKDAALRRQQAAMVGKFHHDQSSMQRIDFE